MFHLLLFHDALGVLWNKNGSVKEENIEKRGRLNRSCQCVWENGKKCLEPLFSKPGKLILAPVGRRRVCGQLALRGSELNCVSKDGAES